MSRVGAVQRRLLWTRLGSRLAVPALLLAALLMPHPAPGFNAVGWPVAARNIRDLLTAAVVVASCLGLGYAIRGRLHLNLPTGGVDVGLSFVVGAAAWGGVLMILGVAGLFTAGWVIGSSALLLFLAVGLGAWHDTMVGLRGAVQTAGDVFAGRFGRLLLAAHGVGLAVLIVFALGPEGTWDGPMYHLELPRQFLARGEIYLPPDNLHAAFVGVPHMLYTVMLAGGVVRGQALLEVVCFALILVALATGGAAVFGNRAGLLASLFLWSAGGLTMVAFTPMVDAFATLVVSLALFVVVEARHSPGQAVLLLGLLGGIGASVKYQTVPYLLGASLVALVLLWGGTTGLKAWHFLAAGGLTVVAAGPFLAKNLILIGAPFYPLLSAPRLPEWLSSGVLRGREPPAGIFVFHPLRSVRQSFSAVDWIVRPEGLTVEASGAYQGLSPWYLLSLLVFFKRERVRSALVVLVPALIGIVLIVAVSPATNLRYLLPSFPALAFVAGGGLDAALARLSNPVRSGVLVLVVLGAVFPTVRWAADPSTVGGRMDVAVGALSEAQWEHGAGAGQSGRIREVAGWVDQNVGDGRVLMLYEARGWYFSADVIQDNLLVNWPQLQLTLGDDCPDLSTITHVLVNRAAIRFYEARGLEDDQSSLSTFPGFAARCLQLVGTRADVELYEVRSDG